MKTFDLIGGWLCLDFTNTADGDINTEWTEQLNSYADLVNWAGQAGLLDEKRSALLIKEADAHPAEAEAVLNHAIQLRMMLYRVFSAVAADETPDLTDFNRAINEAAQHLQSVLKAGNYNWDWSAEPEALDQMLWPVIWSAVDLLHSPQHKLVRECGGNTCSWLFLDTSRNHSRRWCDMKDCGNRAKARAHYHRIKQTG